MQGQVGKKDRLPLHLFRDVLIIFARLELEIVSGK